MLASSSKGNCYALICGHSVLLLEAGIPVAKLRKNLPVVLSRVVACLVTHEHGDHAGYVRQFWEAGIQILSNRGTIEQIGYGMSIPPLDYFWYGWTISTFSTSHDAVDPVGYQIDAPDGTRVIFATDTYLLPYKFRDVNIWMLECNYELPLLKENIAAGLVDEKQAKRILESHMSVDHVCEFLIHQDLRKTQAIYLLHGSDRNINKQKAVSTVRAVTGKPVYMEGV